jgi:hypothetical protein
MTCCIISMSGNIVLLLMAAFIAPMKGSRVLTAGGRFPMMGERISAHVARGSRHIVRTQHCSGSHPWMQTECESVLIDAEGSM